MNDERNHGCRLCAWHTSAKQGDKEFHNCWKWGQPEYDALDGYRYHMLDLCSAEGKARNVNGRCPGFMTMALRKRFKPDLDNERRIQLAAELVHGLQKEHTRTGQ